MSQPNQVTPGEQAPAGQPEQKGQKIDFLSGEYPEAVVRAADMNEAVNPFSL